MSGQKLEKQPRVKSWPRSVAHRPRRSLVLPAFGLIGEVVGASPTTGAENFRPRLIIILLAAFFVLTGCEKVKLEPGVPGCLVRKTKDLKKQTPCENGATVQEYKFQEKIVYTLFTGDCITESGVEVIDLDCKHLGYLGGLAGGTKINGLTFSSHATFLRTIWKQ